MRWLAIDTWLLAGIVGGGLVLFGRVVTYGFTNWDDIHFLLENPVIRGLTGEHLGQAFTPGGIPRELIYIPLTYVSHMIEVALFGLSPRAIHATNLALHLANACLAYLLARRLSDDRRVAAVAALIFLCHPLQVEPVAWAMGRKDLLSCLFGLLSLLAYHRYLLSRGSAWLAVCLLAFALGMLAKPTLIVLPALLILMECYVQGPPPPSTWHRYLPFVALAILVYVVNSRMPTQVTDLGEPVWLQLLAAPWVGFEWVRRFVLFGRPLPFHAWPSAASWPWLAAGGALFLGGLIAALAWAFRRQVTPVWFGLLFFGIGMAPSLMLIFQPRDFITADRYGYFPLFGLAYMAGLGWQRLGAEWRRPYGMALAAWGVAALALAWVQAGVWENSRQLWTPVVARYPDNPVARNNLGMAYRDAGDRQAALAQFQAGLAVTPTHVTLRANLAETLLDSGRPEAALLALEAYRHERLLALRGKAYRLLAAYALAEDACRQAIGLNPGFAPAWLELGALFAVQGRFAEAEAAFREARRLGDTSGELAFNLGIALEQQGNLAAAEVEYRQAVRLNPALADAWYNLGSLLLQVGAWEPAREALTVAHSLRPDAETAINLGVAMQRLGRLDEALAWLRLAAATEGPQQAFAIFLLGETHRQAGDREAARAAYEQALEIAPDFTPARQALAQLPPPAP